MTTTFLKNSNTYNIVLGVIIGILIFLVVWLGYKDFQLTRDEVDVNNPVSIVVKQIKNVSELATAIFEMDAVVPVSERGFLVLESKLLYIAHGDVRVGVNLNEFQEKNIHIEGDNITVTLPPLKILDSKLDLEHSSVYSYDRGFLGWGPDVVKLQEQAQREAIHKVEKAACQDWLIQEATDRVEQTVDSLLTVLLKDTDYKVTVKTQLPAEGSCKSNLG